VGACAMGTCGAPRLSRSSPRATQVVGGPPRRAQGTRLALAIRTCLTLEHGLPYTAPPHTHVHPLHPSPARPGARRQHDASMTNPPSRCSLKSTLCDWSIRPAARPKSQPAAPSRNTQSAALRTQCFDSSASTAMLRQHRSPQCEQLSSDARNPSVRCLNLSVRSQSERERLDASSMPGASPPIVPMPLVRQVCPLYLTPYGALQTVDRSICAEPR